MADCEGCGVLPAIGTLDEDPYDVISGSPITRPVAYCLRCYNLRVIAAIRVVSQGRRVP